MEKKRIFWSILSIIMVAMLSIVLSSCNKDDDEGGSGNGGKFTYGGKSYGISYGYYNYDTRAPKCCDLYFFNCDPYDIANFPSLVNFAGITIYNLEGSADEVPTGEFEDYRVHLVTGAAENVSGDQWGGYGNADAKLIIKKNGNRYSVSFSNLTIGNDVDEIHGVTFNYTGTLIHDNPNQD